MADGTLKPIEQIETGDVYHVAEPETGETGPRTVDTPLVSNGVKTLVQITVVQDGVTGSFTVTENHPFWAPSLRTWVTAGQLVAGVFLQTSSGVKAEVFSTRTWSAAQRVHNLEIDDIHTYYAMAGSTSVLVHNCPNLERDAQIFPNAHVLSEHVNISDADLLRDAARKHGGKASRFTDAQTAQQVVDYAIAASKRRIDRWLSNGVPEPLEITGRFGVNNPIGVTARRDGTITPSSNSYYIRLEKAPGHKPGGYYVYTAYPN